MSKPEVRAGALRVRKTLSPDEVGRLSARIQARVTATEEFAGARTLASYVAKRDEVQTSGIISLALKSGKKVIVPRSDPSSLALRFHEIRSLAELSPGTYGIMEPAGDTPTVALSDSNLVLVPVVAWDIKGNRMGYGKGYFDRSLRSRGGATCAGLAFELQRQERVPSAATDVPLDMVVTEERILRFGRGTA